MNLFEATVTFTATGLVLAASEKQALSIVNTAMQRLVNERDDHKVELSKMIEGDYEPDYLILNGDATFDEAKAALRRNMALDVA